MNLKSGLPFWLIKSGLPFNYPKLSNPLKTDVLILGGGISGALAGYYLSNEGIECTILDKRQIGMGSTCASTSLLQYELDLPLCRLQDKIGNPPAVRVYHLCAEAVVKLQKVAADIGLDEFTKRESLFFADNKKHLQLLKDEYKIRRENNFNVEFLDDSEIRNRYNFCAPAAILSDNAAATNAYKFTHLLHQSTIKKGNKVYERTAVKIIEHSKNSIVAKTSNGIVIQAKRIIYATGYESLNQIDKEIAKLYSTYAIASEKMDDMTWWHNELLLWNAAHPYLYMRSADDDRILMGGRDEPFYDPEKRDKLIEKKSAQLVKDFNHLFPGKVFEPQFAWTGTFAETKDSLPFIGNYHNEPGSYFTLGFGGNGIIFSLIAAEILTDLIKGRFNPNAHLFSFERM